MIYKFFPILLLSLVGLNSSFANACANLDGTWEIVQCSNNRTGRLVIEQRGCEEFRIKYNPSSSGMHARIGTTLTTTVFDEDYGDGNGPHDGVYSVRADWDHEALLIRGMDAEISHDLNREFGLGKFRATYSQNGAELIEVMNYEGNPYLQYTCTHRKI